MIGPWRCTWESSTPLSWRTGAICIILIALTTEITRISDQDADAALTKALRGRQGRLTKADAVAVSGLPAYTVDDSLDRLLKRFRSRLEVTEDGELLYSFDPSLRRRGEPTLGDKLRALGRTLVRAGMWLFKAWIAVTLVAYVVLFVALIIAAMFAGDNKRSSSSSRSRSGGDGLGWLIWWMLPDGRYGSGYSTDRYGRRLSNERSTRRFGDGKPKKKFFAGVFDFVFGPARPAEDPRGRDREVLSYLREHDGRMTATDLVTLFGGDYRHAEEEATRLMVEYEGEPEVTDDGVLVYAFPNLLRTAGEASQALAPWKPLWERTEVRPALTGNSTGLDTAIGAFAGFNLFASFFAANWIQMSLHLHGAAWSFWLTTFPLTFFTIFLGVPLLRALGRKFGDRRRAREKMERELVRRVLDANGAPLPLEPGLLALAIPLEGEPDAEGEKGIIRFPRPAEERAALAKYLKSVDIGAEKRIGKVIFGGADDEADRADVPPLLKS